MGSQKNKNELWKLLGALCDETITDEQYAILCRRLQADHAARKLYFGYLEIHLKLAEWARIESPLQPLALPRQELDRMIPARRSVDAQDGHRVWRRRIAAFLAASLLIVLAGHRWVNSERESQEVVQPNGVVGEAGAPYFATLLRSANCVWHGDHRPRFDGQRLLSRELRLEKGLAEFRFDTGVRIVMEGPATLTIDSNRSAKLVEGRIVLHGDEFAEEFALHTPQGVLYDEGTEYGAYVDPSVSTEVHVFQGRVRIESPGHGSANEQIQQVVFSGLASRLDGRTHQSLPLADNLFVREIPSEELPRAPSPHDLMAFEGFSYPGLGLGNEDGGVGWSGPWRDALDDAAPSRAMISPNQSLMSLACDHIGVGGRFYQDGRGTSWRSLSTPIRLDTDAVYYLSFYFQKSRNAAVSGVTQYGSLSLRPSSPDHFLTERLAFGMTSENYLIMIHNDQILKTPPRLVTGDPYFYVTKIVAGQMSPDHLMLRVYGPQEPVEEEEPAVWSCVSRPQHGDTVYSEILIYVGGDARFDIDEIRIGSTWAAVTSDN